MDILPPNICSQHFRLVSFSKHYSSYVYADDIFKEPPNIVVTLELSQIVRPGLSYGKWPEDNMDLSDILGETAILLAKAADYVRRNEPDNTVRFIKPNDIDDHSGDD